MKKLLSSVALLGVAAMVASPAFAADDSAVKLDLSGYARGYVSYVSQDDDSADVNSFDMLRDTEIHFTGETTLDSGLSVGAHVETAVDSDDSTSTVDESYLYFSGNWGRVNFGQEDGAAYLLQVAAPSADSNFDGVRQYIQPLNYEAATSSSDNLFAIDYANDEAKDADKLTYLSPVFNGFQVGASYTPEVSDGAAADVEGNRTKDADFDEAYEAAVRYEGTLSNVGFAAGAGYTHIDNRDVAPAEDFKEWNVGLDLNIADFGVGAVYTENNDSTDGNDDVQTWVLGADYTVGAYKIGASYLTQDDEVNDIDTDRYAAGVTYSYAPGLSFRGSISHTQVDDNGAATDVDGTAVLLGTQVNF